MATLGDINPGLGMSNAARQRYALCEQNQAAYRNDAMDEDTRLFVEIYKLIDVTKSAIGNLGIDRATALAAFKAKIAKLEA